jgi:hypothetical protein
MAPGWTASLDAMPSVGAKIFVYERESCAD